MSSFSDLLSTDEIEIDERPGIERNLIQDDPTSPTGKYYALQVMFVDGYDLYTIATSASTADTMVRYQAIVEGIIASIKFVE